MVTPRSHPVEPRRTADVVFFLGAGASAHLEFPVQNHFFGRAAALGLLGRYASLIDYLSSIGMSVDAPTPPAMEAAYRRVDMQVMLGKRYAEQRRDEFLDLIGQVYTAHLDIPTLTTVPQRAYDSLYALLLSLMADHRSVAVLTTNYDLGLETASIRALHSSLTMQQSPALSDSYMASVGWDHIEAELCMHERYLWDYCLPNRTPSATNLVIPIIKLHGSVNWAICPECQQVRWIESVSDASWTRFVRSGKTIPAFRATTVTREKCSYHSVDCPPKLRPLLVPPTWNKWMGDFTMRFIWRQASRMLTSCEHIMFIGFSLPDEDLHIRELLAASLAQNPRARISIFDYCGGEQTGRVAAKLRGRYTGLLDEAGIDESRISFHLGSKFEDSVAHIERAVAT